MIRQSFKPGPAAGREDRVIVSATKFVYRRPHSPIHAPLMRDYKRKLRSVKSVSWAMEDFSPDKAWDEGQRRLAEPAAVDSREVTA